MLLGVAGASFAIALPLASRHYPPRHQGLAMGIAGAGNSGTVLTTLAAPRLAEHVGWHAVFGLALIPVVLVWVAFALLAKEPPAPRPPGHDPRPARDRCAERDAWRLCGLYAVTFGAFVGLASFLPIFFHDQYGISKVDAATIVAVGAALGSLPAPARRLPRRPRRRHDGADRRLRRSARRCCCSPPRCPRSAPPRSRSAS